MRILQVARQFQPSVGGVESCVLNVSRELLTRGHEVEVVTLDRNLRSGEEYPREAIVDGIPTRRIPYFGATRYPIAPSVLKRIAGYDVVHVHCIDFCNVFLALGAMLRLHDRPVVVTS